MKPAGKDQFDVDAANAVRVEIERAERIALAERTKNPPPLEDVLNDPEWTGQEEP